MKALLVLLVFTIGCQKEVAPPSGLYIREDGGTLWLPMLLPNLPVNSDGTIARIDRASTLMEPQFFK